MTRDNATAHSAIDYDTQIEKSIPYYAAIHNEVLRFVSVVHPVPQYWLDTGCGTGTLVCKALSRFRCTRFFLADPAPAMLAEARAKFQGSNSERVTFLPAAGTAEIAVEPRLRFDVITAIQCHHYLNREDRRSALTACRKLLAQDGLLVVFENVRPASDRTLELGKRYWESYQIEKGKTQAEARAHVNRLDREFFPISVAQHLDLLREVGFETAELLWYSYLQAGFFALAAHSSNHQ